MILVRFFNRNGCPPCAAIKSLVLSGNKYRNVTVLDYNLADDTEDDFINFNIASVPTVIIENNGSQVVRYTNQATIESNYISRLESLGAELSSKPSPKPSPKPIPTGDDNDFEEEGGINIFKTAMILGGIYYIGKQYLQWNRKQ